jgi:hypothetical protein
MRPSQKARVIVACDAETRLRAAREWLSAHPRDAQILVLAPTWEAGDDFVRAASRDAGARFGLMRSTLERLVSNLATPILAREGRAQLSRLSLEAIAARAAHLLSKEGALAYFSPIAWRPGFARTITHTIEGFE